MSKTSTTKFELWRLKKGYAFFSHHNDKARALLEPSAELAWTVEARTWLEARIRMHELLIRALLRR